MKIEPIESRILLSVSLGTDGWTKFTAIPDTRIVYVSSSAGNDKNTGLSTNSPLKTLAKAESLIRDGKPDWLLLKAGDTFSTGIPPWKTSGRSAQEPQLISSYGTGARPIIDSGVHEGFVTFGGTGHPINNIAIAGLQFFANTYNGKNGSFSTTGIRLTRQGSNWLVENCLIKGYKDNITLDADGTGLSNFTLRRSQILDAYVASKSVGNGEAQGIFIGTGTKNAVLEQNVIDHNGWNASVPGANASEFNHDVYIHAGSTNTTVRDNIISQSSLYGVLLRGNGIVENNLFIHCPYGIDVSAGGSTISGNVILDGTDMQGTTTGATGIEVAALSGITITKNIIAHEKSSAQFHVTGIRLDPGVKNATVSTNLIYDWQQSINNAGASNITIKGNVLQDTNAVSPLIVQTTAANPAQFHYSNNTYGTPRSKVNQLNNKDQTLAAWITATKETGSKFQIVNYVNPNIDVAPSFTTWINSVRNQSKSNWNTAFVAPAVLKSISAGFTVAK
ncbi:MAG TPA: right-handed parallel beta-helix repeat-containing protein [Tepidisphaeraceae bacterium]|jgi:hypothetical protein|nr:right-handed parallel beta-helix repeat-containing protein [Tepidisphaeraceae bacterium]